MNSPQKQWKRRQYLVNPGFQLRFMAYVGCAVLFGFAIIYVANFWYFGIMVDQGKELGLNPDHVYFDFIEQQRVLLNQAFFGVTFGVFSLLMVAGLFLSHKIAGPVYRVQKYTQELIASGVAPYRVSLRKGDFFPELADIVNDLVEHAKDDVKTPAPAQTAPESPEETVSAPAHPG